MSEKKPWDTLRSGTVEPQPTKERPLKSQWPEKSSTTWNRWEEPKPGRICPRSDCWSCVRKPKKLSRPNRITTTPKVNGLEPSRFGPWKVRLRRTMSPATKSNQPKPRSKRKEMRRKRKSRNQTRSFHIRNKS